MLPDIEEMELQHKKPWITGLVISCPLGIRVDNCQFKDLAKLPLIKSIREIDKMSENKLDKIISLHKKCLQKREKTMDY